MSRLQHLKDTGMAWALGLGLLALGAALDDAEDAMTPNLNAPAIEQGPLTADELASWRAAHECCSTGCDGGRLCAIRVQPAAAVSDLVESEPRGRHSEGPLTRLWLRLVRALT